MTVIIISCCDTFIIDPTFTSFLCFYFSCRIMNMKLYLCTSFFFFFDQYTCIYNLFDTPCIHSTKYDPQYIGAYSDNILN